MKRIFRGFFVGILCAAFFACGFTSGIPLGHAGEAGVVTLLDLGSDCLPCEIQDRIVRRVEQHFGPSLSVRYLDVEKNGELKKQYGISTIPTLIFYDKKGKEVARNEGYMKESAILERIQSLLDAE